MNFLEKKLELQKLKRGAEVELDSGEKVIFGRVKQKRFEGHFEGLPHSYNIPIERFKRVLNENVGKKEKVTLNLVKNELFYVEKGGFLVVLFFNYRKGNTVYAINPLNWAEVRVDESLIYGKVKDLKNEKGK